MMSEAKSAVVETFYPGVGLLRSPILLDWESSYVLRIYYIYPPFATRKMVYIPRKI